MSLAELYPTDHVRQAMRSRNVSWGEILDTVEQAEVVYGPDEKGNKVCQKGELAVVVSSKGDVVTVLLRSEHPWTNEDARTRKTTLAQKRVDLREIYQQHTIDRMNEAGIHRAHNRHFYSDGRRRR